jgi:hypothetical protein
VNGELRIDVTGLNLAQLIDRVDAVAPEAVGRGMEHIHQVASPLVPVETGRLVGSGTVEVDGDTASLHYEGPYARYQHERLDLKHEHGQAKYLEQPVATEAQTAVDIIAHTIKDAL